MKYKLSHGTKEFMKTESKINTEPQAGINLLLVAVTPETSLSTDGTALDGVSGLSGSGIGATSKNIQLFNLDCHNELKKIESDTVNCIVTDPPYLYLDNQKLDRDFNEDFIFSEFKRILKPNGFVVLFGRGSSFYRWNYKLEQLGLKFKEEIVWDKSYCSSPLMSLSRVHETLSIHTLGNGIIKKVKVPYLKMKGHDIASIKQDIDRLRTVFKNADQLEEVKKWLEDGTLSFDGEYEAGLTITSGRKRVNRCISSLQTIQNGMNEKSIIRIQRDHYELTHPTQKPIELIERILKMISNEGDLIVDPFAGSFSTGLASYNLNRIFM